MTDTSTPHTGRIFISYRRADSAGYAGRLYDRLAAHFGKESIFMDVDTIQAGMDFVEVLENAVQSCDVVVALLGRQWLNIKDEAGERRLDNPQDFVRIEVAAALNRGIRVIPVLVDGTSIPNSGQLPGNLKPLARRNAVLVNHYSFHTDANRLIEQLELALKAAEDSKILKAKKLEAEEVQKKRQAEIENLLSQADIAFELQDWELAKEKLAEVLTLEPNHTQAQVKLAVIERKQRETKERNLAAEKAKQEATQKADREKKERERLEQEEKDRQRKNRKRKKAEEKARQTALLKERQQESIESFKNFFSRIGKLPIIIAGGIVLLFIVGYLIKGIGNSTEPEPAQTLTYTNLATATAASTEILPTATLALPTNTAAPTEILLTQLPVPTNTATEIPIPVGKTLFSMDFSEINNDWNWGKCCYIEDGKFYMERTEANYAEPIFSGPPPFWKNDQAVGVTFTHLSDAVIGVYCRKQTVPDFYYENSYNRNSYLFKLDLDERVAQIWFTQYDVSIVWGTYTHVYKSDSTVLLDSQPISEAERYFIYASCRGSSLDFYVNGKMVAHAVNGEISGNGTAGIFFQTNNPAGDTAEFDDFFVSEP